MTTPLSEGSAAVPPPYSGPPGQSARITFSSSERLPALLAEANGSIILSTYMIGNIVTIGTREGRVFVQFHTFDRPMGMDASSQGIVVGTRNQVWFMPALSEIGPQLPPVGRYDTAYFARRSQYTGNIQCHELAWVGKEVWIVNTRFSCLCTFHPTCHFAPRWRPPFISALAPEDRCHLNGFAAADGQPRYATALAETDTPDGWRAVKATSGCLMDVAANAVVCRGMAMPHSPRLVDGRLYVLHSGLGRLEMVDPASGKRDVVCELPGYTRGLAVVGRLAFVGLSKIRPSSSMDGVPIAARAGSLKCGIWVVDLGSGAVAGNFEFTSGIDELFDVQIIRGVASPYISGPLADLYSEQTHWALPPN